MNNDQKFWLLFWAIVAVVIVGLDWAIAWGSTVTARQAISAGLIEVETPWRTTTRWAKP